MRRQWSFPQFVVLFLPLLCCTAKLSRLHFIPVVMSAAKGELHFNEADWYARIRMSGGGHSASGAFERFIVTFYNVYSIAIRVIICTEQRSGRGGCIVTALHHIWTHSRRIIMNTRVLSKRRKKKLGMLQLSVNMMAYDSIINIIHCLRLWFKG